MAQLNKKSVDAIAKSIRKLNDNIIKLNKDHDELRADNVKAIETNKKLKTTVDNLKKSSDNLKKSTNKLSAIEKEKISIAKRHEIAIAKTTLAFSKSNRELIKAKEESRKAERQSKLLVLATNAVKGSYDRISASLRANIDRFKKLSQAERENDAVGGKLVKTIRKQDLALKKLDSQIGRSQRNVGNYSGALGRARGALTSLLGAFGLTGGLIAFVGILKGAVATSINFEKTFTNVLTLLDKVDKSKFGGMLRTGAADLIAEFGFAVDDVNKALFDAISAGVSAGDAIRFLRESSILAIGGVTGLTTAVDGVTSIMNAYGLAASEVNKVTSAFFTAQKFGKTTVAELSAEVGKVAPVAKTAGVSFQELLSTFAELTKQGISTQESSTAIKATITALIKPSVEARQKFDELGISVGLNSVRQQGLFNILQKVSQAAEENADNLTVLIPNVRALTGVAALGTEALIDYNKILQQVNLDYGENSSLVEALNEQLDTQAQSIKSLGGEFRALGIELAGEGTTISFLTRITGGFIGALRNHLKVKKLIRETDRARREEGKDDISDTIIFAQEIRKLTIAQAENQLLALRGLEGILAQHEGTITQIRLLEEHIVKLNELNSAKGNESETTKIQTQNKVDFAKATREATDAIDDQIEAELALFEAQEFGEPEPDDLTATVETNKARTDAIIREEERLFEKRRALAKLTIDDRDALLSELLEIDKEEIQSDIDKVEAELALKTERNAAFFDLDSQLKDLILEKELNETEQIELLEERKRAAKFATLSAIRSIFGQESIFGKAALAAQRALAIQQNLITLGIIGTKQAEGVAKSAAAAPFPLNIPLIAGTLAQFVSILALFKKVPKLAKGTDGKYDTPESFIAGEAGAEAVFKGGKGKIIDKPTLFTGMKNSLVVSNPELKSMATNKGSTIINNNIDTDRIINGFAKHLKKNKTTINVFEKTTTEARFGIHSKTYIS